MGVFQGGGLPSEAERGPVRSWRGDSLPRPLQFLQSHKDPGAVLLLPFAVSCVNLAVPRLYSGFRLVERYETPRQEVYVLLIRWVCWSPPAPASVSTEGVEWGREGPCSSVFRKEFQT